MKPVYKVFILSISSLFVFSCGEETPNNGPALDHISLAGTCQTTFVVDEEFNSTGLYVVAHYEDGTSNNATGFEVTNPDMSTPGVKVRCPRLSLRIFSKMMPYRLPHTATS